MVITFSVKPGVMGILKVTRQPSYEIYMLQAPTMMIPSKNELLKVEPSRTKERVEKY